MNKKLLITASLLGVSGVIIGAFGAHGLKESISVESQQVFETGVRYQMYHAIVLLFIGTTSYISEKSKKTIFYLMLMGIVLFSGSIYSLATNSLTAFDFKKIGFITPIGGLFLILSWLVMLLSFLKIKSDKSKN